MSDFDSLTGDRFKKTLVPRLINVADRVRNIATRLGARRYRVFIVAQSWTTPMRTRGVPQIRVVRELLPVPVVDGISSLSQDMADGTAAERGTVTLTGVSGRYTEEELMGYSDTGEPPAPSDEVFYEVEVLRLDNIPGDKLRFELVGRPFWDYENVQWQIRLVRAQGDRARSGAPHTSTRVV